MRRCPSSVQAASEGLECALIRGPADDLEEEALTLFSWDPPPDDPPLNPIAMRKCRPHATPSRRSGLRLEGRVAYDFAESWSPALGATSNVSRPLPARCTVNPCHAAHSDHNGDVLCPHVIEELIFPLAAYSESL